MMNLQKTSKSETILSQHVQRQKLREFDRELFSYTGQIAWFLPGLFSFLLLILMLIPIQEIGREELHLWAVSCMLSMWISFFILLPYINVTDTLTPQKGKSQTWRKLRYLPISKKQYGIVRIYYVFRFAWKLTIIGILLQCLGAVIATNGISIWNLVYAAGVLLVVPIIAGGLILWGEKIR